MPKNVTTKQRGDAAEARALRHLQDHGLQLVQRNYRTPGRGGGEIDLIMRESDNTIVFVEVRQRAQAAHGGALAGRQRYHHAYARTTHCTTLHR